MLVVGCNHRTAPLAIRERLAMAEHEQQQALHNLRSAHPDCEGVILSTCNRVELYVACPKQTEPDADQLLRLLAGWRDVDPAELSGHTYQHADVHAIRHCFRVVSSLDSMVLGESQILWQARQAIETADRTHALGTTLREVFDRAFTVARRVRNETQIAAGRASIGSLAVDFARQIFAQLAERTVLMIGAGKMGRTTVRHLTSQGAADVMVTNRTSARAEQMAAQLQATAVPYEQLDDHLVAADIVITCTGADEPIIRPAQIAQVLRRRSYRPMLMVDIAVPRDVDQAVGEFDQVYLYNIDDLQGIVDATLAERQQEIAACNAIIEEELLAFLQRQQSRDAGPVLTLLRERLDQIAEQELQWALPKLTNDVEKNRQVIRHFKHRLVQKVLHFPRTYLSERAQDGSSAIHAEVLRQLFDLTEEE
ncbi:MAG TPA: glutamyl-tRNA reductase [Phycisphaerae bacterium]|nr:glutamyl-tRNA reductase [Phycisphaerae bacterium]